MSTSAFISDRTDGLGERLRSLTNAIYLATTYNARMFYEWKNRQGWQREFNSIDDDHKLFSREFIDTHSFTANQHEISMLEAVDFADFANQPGQIFLPENIKIRVHQAPVYRYIPGLKFHYKGEGFRKSFNKIIFNRRICVCIKHAQSVSLPENATAIHLRAGDVIYGKYNINARFCGKAIPWEIADSILSEIKQNGKNVILFGQDTSLLSYLAAKHQAYLATTLLDPKASDPIEIAIQEIFLMSRCARIIAGSSGFALLASSLAGEIHDQISRLVTSPAATILNRLSEQLDQSISVEQRVFSLRWIIGMNGYALSPEELLKVAHRGLSLLPNDLFFLLTTASALASLGSANDASRIVSSALSSYSTSELRRMLSSSAFGKPESYAYLLNPLMPLIPTSILDP